MAIPWNTPKQLKGKSVAVLFSVAQDGTVTDVVVTPPIANQSWAKKFDEIIRAFRFTPAKDAAGKPHADTLTVTFTF